MKIIEELLNNWSLWLMASLTLGLAPFFPEPHIFGKVQWVLGGAKGMALVDWLDLALHGTPWVFLIRILFLRAFQALGMKRAR